jgi:hypothetical protein
MFGAFLSVFLLLMIGAAALTLVCSDLGRWNLPAKIGLSFGFGLLILTVTLFIASLCGAKPTPVTGLIEAILLLGIVVAIRRDNLAHWLPHKSEQDTSETLSLRVLAGVLFVFVIGILFVVSAASLLEPIVEWDVIAIWGLKAEVLLHEPVITSRYFSDLPKAYSHLDYPLLWPFAIAWVWSCIGSVDLVKVKVLAPTLLASLLFLFFGLLRRKASRPHALFFTAVLAAIPMLLTQTSRMLADAPLAFFALGAFVCTYLWLESGHPDDLRIASTFAVGMLFTKNEGIGFWFILGIITATGLAAERRIKLLQSAGLWLGAVPVLVMLPWFIFRSGIPKIHEDYGGRINPVYFLGNLSRIPDMLGSSIRFFLNWNDWLLFWPLAFLLLILTPMHSCRRPMVFLLAGAVLPLLMYGYIYIITPWNLSNLMDATANRLLLHVAPLWVFLFAEQVRACKLLPFSLA